jgi:hypothetical protein
MINGRDATKNRVGTFNFQRPLRPVRVISRDTSRIATVELRERSTNSRLPARRAYPGHSIVATRLEATSPPRKPALKGRPWINRRYATGSHFDIFLKKSHICQANDSPYSILRR